MRLFEALVMSWLDRLLNCLLPPSHYYIGIHSSFAPKKSRKWKFIILCPGAFIKRMSINSLSIETMHMSDSGDRFSTQREFKGGQRTNEKTKTKINS
jgi:hypothetical protein